MDALRFFEKEPTGRKTLSTACILTFRERIYPLNAKAARTLRLRSGDRLPVLGRLFLLLICLFIPAEPLASADTVTLTNGDKFTCEIVKLEGGKLTIKLLYADGAELTLDWKTVSSITSETSLKMRLDNGTRMTAKLQPTRQAGQILPEGSAAPLALNRVVGIEPEKRKGSWTDNLSLSTNLNGGYSGANGLRTFNWNAQNFYWGEKWEVSLVGSQNVSWTGESGTTANQLQGQANINRFLTHRLFVFPWIAGVRIREEGGRRGSTRQVGGGVGWAFVKHKDHHFEVMEGLINLRNNPTFVFDSPTAQSPIFGSARQAAAFLSVAQWQRTSGESVTWTIQAIYVNPFEAHLRNQMGFQFNVDVPLAGPFSVNVHVQDYTTPVNRGLLSIEGLSVTSGFGISL